jgi:catechol 2,3-dioxygenase-like lactoylglutathione lyase family enzyme
MAVRDVTVVSVPASDQERAKEFYVGKLGFELVREDDSVPGIRWVQVAPKGGATSLTLVTWTRRGLGRRIVAECEAAARREGFRQLALLSTLPGVPLYLACGFEPLSGDRRAFPAKSPEAAGGRRPA